MIAKTNLIFLLILCLSAFSISSFGQTDDEKITQLQQEIKQLKQQKIKTLEEERNKLKAEIEGSPVNISNPVELPSTPPPVASPAQPVTPSATPSNPNPSTAIVSPPSDVPSGTQPQVNCITNTINPSEATRLNEAICRITNRVEQEGKFTPNLNIQQLSTVLAAKITQNEFFLESESRRTDKQLGSSPNNAGTTSLAVKGGMPAVIGWAVEQGAATTAVSGNTVTVRVNPYNLGKAIYYNQGILDLKFIEPSETPIDIFLRKLSLGFSFDTTRGTDPPVLIASKQQLSSFSFRYEFVNRRNPFSRRYDERRTAFFASQTENFDKVTRAFRSVTDFSNNRFRIELLNKWLEETNTELSLIPTNLNATTRRARIQAVIESRIKALPTEELSKQEGFRAAIDSFVEGTTGFSNARDKLIEDINKGAVATFEYTNHREVNAPDTSNFRFILEKGILGGTNADLTFNASLSMFNKKPTSSEVKRIKDFDFTLQLDFPLRNTLLEDSFLSFAGQYKRQSSDVSLPNGMIAPNTMGDIAVGQIKLTIPIGDSGIRLPFSLTFANRTDLIKESDVRANFGFTFDLDPLFAGFNPFSRR